MKQEHITIAAPNLVTAVFEIKGNAPLVQHRFGAKAKQGMLDKMEEGTNAKKGKAKHEATELDEIAEAGKYVSKEGWEGFNASAIRNALISACRLVNFKMTIGKLALFCVQDGWDKFVPTIPLVRIYGKSRRLDTPARVATGNFYVTIRPCYDEWSAKVKIRFDADQFTLKDVANLLSRAGAQVGIGEGRPDSRDGAGMGWGTFDVVSTKEV
jgi:hypothetical protein